MAAITPPPAKADVVPISPTSGQTRKVFVGHTINDIYIRGGKHYGPGTVELPYGTDKDVEDFNDFVASVKRVQMAREPEHRVNLDAVDTPLPKQLSQATAQELAAQLRALGHDVPMPESVGMPEVVPTEPTEPESLVERMNSPANQFRPIAPLVTTQVVPGAVPAPNTPPTVGAPGS